MIVFRGESSHQSTTLQSSSSSPLDIAGPSTSSSSTPSLSSSPDIMSHRNVALVPVHQEDFKKINEFAEAAWICRDLKNADKIKEMRRELLKEVKIF